MSNNRILDDLRELAGQDSIPATTFRRLITSALADLVDTVNNLEAKLTTEEKQTADCMDKLNDEITELNKKVCDIENCTRQLATNIKTNPAIKAGLLFKEYPSVIKVVAGLIIALLAIGGVQAVVDFIRSIFF